MFENPMWVSGDIESGKPHEAVTSRFSQLMQTTACGDPITVYINSAGGSMALSLGIYDLIKHCGRKTTGIVTGIAHSGALTVLQGCERRLLTPLSTLMMHASSVRINTTPASIETAELKLNALKDSERKMFEIYAARTQKSVDEIAQLARTDTYFSAAQAVAFGFADEILDHHVFARGDTRETITRKKSVPFKFRGVLLRRVVEFDLSTRVLNCLHNADVVFIGDLVQHTERSLRGVKNLGRATLEDIKTFLATHNLKLGVVFDPPFASSWERLRAEKMSQL